MWAEESRGVEAESTANERVKERGRNQVEAPVGQVGGRAASHPLAALPRAPEARGEGVRGPPGPGGARGVLVKTAAAKGGVARPSLTAALTIARDMARGIGTSRIAAEVPSASARRKTGKCGNTAA